MFNSILLFLFVQIFTLNAYDYCGKNTPCKGPEHIVCSMSSEITPYEGTTKFVMHIPETAEVRKTFLHAHNTFRNTIAKGDCTSSGNVAYKTAARMREVIWDKELAYIAKKHASLCKMQHSKCHATKRFPAAGQNLGFMTTTKKKGMVVVANGTVCDFFKEYLLATNSVELIDKCCEKGTGHFTVVCSDRVSRIGCAIAVGKNCGSNPRTICYFTTCQYDFTNLIDSYVYITGEPLSKCSDWKSPGKSDKYPYLCKNKGYIFDSKGAQVK